MPKFFSKDAIDALHGIEEGFKEAKQGLEEVPSKMLPVIKEVAVAGAGVFRIFNGLDALYSIYGLYKEGLSGNFKEDSLSILRAIGNVGIVALSGIAAAVAFGASVVAAPLIGAVLGAVTVVKNTFDLMALSIKGNKLENKIEALDKELNQDDIHVKQNLEAINDLAQRQLVIADLMQEHANVKKGLYDFDKAPNDKKADIIKERVASLEKGIVDNNKINSFVSQNAAKLKDVKFLERTIDKTQHESIRKFATELKDTLQSLNDVNKQIDQLPNKYSKAPFDKLSSDQRKDLISLDRKFLDERKVELGSKVTKLLEPGTRLQENVKSQTELRSYSTNDPAKNNEAYTKNMADKLSEIKGSVKEKHDSLKERKKYTQLFLGKDTLDQGPKAIAAKIDAKFGKTLERAKLASDLKQCQIEKKKKWKNIGLGLLGLGIAIAACIPPAQALLGLGLIAVGIVSGVNAIYDYKMKNKEKENLEKETKGAELANKVEHEVVLGQMKTVAKGLDTILSDAPVVENDHAHDAHDAHDHKATVVHALNAASSPAASPTSLTPTTPEQQQDPVPSRPRAGSSGSRD